MLTKLINFIKYWFTLRYWCDQCDFTTTSKDGLNRHYGKKHKVANTREL